MSYATVRAAVKTRLAAVSGIENVNDHEVWTLDTLDEAEWQTLFLGVDQGGQRYIHTWFIGQKGFQEKTLPYGSRRVRRDLLLTGILSAYEAEASYNLFQDLLDAVKEAFNATSIDRTLGGVCLTYSLVQCAGTSFTKFQDTDSHIGVLTLTTEEIVGGVYPMSSIRYPVETVNGTRTVFTFATTPPAHSLLVVDGVANDISDSSFSLTGNQVTIPFPPSGLFGYW